MMTTTALQNTEWRIERKLEIQQANKLFLFLRLPTFLSLVYYLQVAAFFDIHCR